MTLLAHYRSGRKKPYCSFVLLPGKALGGEGFLQWIPIDFSGGVMKLHAAPIATPVSPSLALQRSAPPLLPPPPTHY